MATPVTLDQLNAMDRPGYIGVLGAIFENAPWVAEAAYAAGPHATLDALHASMMAAVTEADETRKLAFLRGHPELGGRLARAGAIGQASRTEQGSLGLDRLSIGEFARFDRLNTSYRDRFGFPFIIAVRMHTKESLLKEFEARLKNEPAVEMAAAIEEIRKITRLRLEAAVLAPPPPKAAPRAPVAAKIEPVALSKSAPNPGGKDMSQSNTPGRLSTHVLDTHSGRPAAGVRIALIGIEGEGQEIIVQTMTNADGRTDAPLLAGATMRTGPFELHFDMGAYFLENGVALPEPPLFDTVIIRFNISDAGAHHHIPLLATPWGYTTYRGS
jgi:2-oxo-4-hydroxy-4-carboxy-5-ureidoimidazoline decarboxylase